MHHKNTVPNMSGTVLGVVLVHYEVNECLLLFFRQFTTIVENQHGAFWQLPVNLRNKINTLFEIAPIVQLPAITLSTTINDTLMLKINILKRNDNYLYINLLLCQSSSRDHFLNPLLVFKLRRNRRDHKYILARSQILDADIL